jgi:hypothetical protein
VEVGFEEWIGGTSTECRIPKWPPLNCHRTNYFLLSRNSSSNTSSLRPLHSHLQSHFPLSSNQPSSNSNHQRRNSTAFPRRRTHTILFRRRRRVRRRTRSRVDLAARSRCSARNCSTRRSVGNRNDGRRTGARCGQLVSEKEDNRYGIVPRHVCVRSEGEGEGRKREDEEGGAHDEGEVWVGLGGNGKSDPTLVWDACTITFQSCSMKLDLDIGRLQRHYISFGGYVRTPGCVEPGDAVVTRRYDTVPGWVRWRCTLLRCRCGWTQFLGKRLLLDTVRRYCSSLGVCLLE